MNRAAYFIGILVFLASNSILAAGSGGGGGSLSVPDNSRGYSPEQQSDRAFRAGVRHRDKALKHEAKAAKAKNEKAAAKSLARAQKAYKKAIDKQGEALKLNPENYKAANELGYALRKTGDFRKAIGAYNFALKINPNYHQATEYRAEAYLALGLYEQTRQSYMILFRNNRDLADQLMASFDTWAESRAEEFSETEQAFWSWVQERKRIAKMATELSLLPGTEGAQHHWPSI